MSAFPKRRAAPEVRFWEKVDRGDDDSCWTWLAGTCRGYGKFRPGGSRPCVMAHRFAYELLIGPIPPGLVIDHLCRNPSCVNPAHMEPVTNAENVMRGYSPHARNARKDRCKSGHEFTPENTRMTQDGRSRTCIACMRMKATKFRAMREAKWIKLHTLAATLGRVPTLAEAQSVLGTSMQQASRTIHQVFGMRPRIPGTESLTVIPYPIPAEWMAVGE
jgi:hypothetical protein